MDVWITRGLEEGVQFVLSVLWIIVILYGLKSAPKGGKSLLDLLDKLKVKLNRKGVSDLMKSYEMQAVLKDYATGIKNRC